MAISITTEVPLGIGGEYVGVWEDVSNYNTVVKYIATDQNCSAFIEFSSNELDVESSVVYKYDKIYTVPPNRAPVTRQFARLRILNTSGVAQGFLRAGMLLGGQTPASLPLNNPIPPTGDAVLVRALTEEAAIVEGLFEGRMIVNPYGQNIDIDAAEDICDSVVTGFYTGFPTTGAELVEIFSASAEDGAGTLTGALTVQVDGLDASWQPQTEIVTLAGTVGADTLNTYLRVHKVKVLSAGSTGSNVGAITVRHKTTTTTVFTILAATLNNGCAGVFTIPDGCVGYLVSVRVDLLGSPTAALAGYVARRVEGGVWTLSRPWTVSAGQSYVDNIYGGLVLAPRSDIVIRATDAGGANMSAISGFDIRMVSELQA